MEPVYNLGQVSPIGVLGKELLMRQWRKLARIVAERL